MSGTIVTKRPRKRNYVNNPDFWRALLEYNQLCDKCAAEGKEKPMVSNYIGECVMLMSQKYVTKPCFSGYSFRDEMVGDAIENCLMYIRSFKTDRGDNPFAYFTQTIHNAFLRRIAKEKKESYIKNQLCMDVTLDIMELQDHDSDMSNGQIEELRQQNDNSYYEAFEASLKRATAKVERKTALTMLEEE